MVVRELPRDFPAAGGRGPASVEIMDQELCSGRF